MRTAIYARVSTTDKGQDPELQLTDLREFCQRREWTVEGEFVDNGVSGAKDRRPELDKVMELVRKRKVDAVIVWKLDRWGRSVQHLVNSISELGNLGVAFVSYRENIDLSTPAGKLMFHIISAMAEFEREIIRERIRAGIANARRKGKRLGRKPVPPVERLKVIEVHLKHPDLSVRELAKMTGLKKSTVHKTLSDFREGDGDFERFFD
ncbi:MAG: recombinase family protein [Thermodesulfovibrionales bacterium]